MPTPHVETQPAAGAGVRSLLGGAALKLSPNDPYLLGHHAGAAGSYDVVDIDGQPTLVPALSPLVMAGGVNGVSTPRQGEDPRSGWTRAIARHQSRGCIVLDLRETMITDPDLVPPGTPVPCPYLLDHEARGGRFWALVWDRIEPDHQGRGATSVMTEDDRERYHRWRRSLVTSGRLPPPSRQVLSTMRRAALAAVKRARSAPGPDREESIQRAERRLARVLEAIARHEGRTSPAEASPTARMVAEELAAADDQRAQLEAENQELKARLAELEKKPARRSRPAPDDAATEEG